MLKAKKMCKINEQEWLHQGKSRSQQRDIKPKTRENQDNNDHTISDNSSSAVQMYNVAYTSLYDSP